MRAIGIIRRIDNLGRVVIPVEIRRAMHIYKGDPLEIFANEDEVIFKKYSVIKELKHFAEQVADTIYSNLGCIIAVCDKECVVAAAGIPKKEILKRPITPDLEAIIERRETYVYPDKSADILYPIKGDRRPAIACSPIIASGDTYGVILILSGDADPPVPANEADIKLVSAFASYISRQIEN